MEIKFMQKFRKIKAHFCKNKTWLCETVPRLHENVKASASKISVF